MYIGRGKEKEVTAFWPYGMNGNFLGMSGIHPGNGSAGVSWREYLAGGTAEDVSPGAHAEDVSPGSPR